MTRRDSQRRDRSARVPETSAAVHGEFATGNRPQGERSSRSTASPSHWRISAAGFAAIAAAALFIVPTELIRWNRQGLQLSDPLGWLQNCHPDTTLYAVLLVMVVAVFDWRSFITRQKSPIKMAPTTLGSTSPASTITLQPATELLTPQFSPLELAPSVLVGVLGCGVAWLFAYVTGDETLTIHDEHSYHFQAQTIAAGRWWWPSHPELPHLFDQMHVLNEGRFCSRYFPGMGLWLQPWLLLGNLKWSGIAANGLIAGLTCFAGERLLGKLPGRLAGALTAVSPALASFSSLLLAHHPTLLGLMLFFAAYAAVRNRPTALGMFIAGCGLSAAMLCRPLTAAAIAFPWGIEIVAWWLRGSISTEPTSANDGRLNADTLRERSILVMAMGLPLLAGLGLLAWQNVSITGSPLRTPYSEYNRLYTPRHVYGFDNGVIGDARPSDRVLEPYNHWAENLTFPIAVFNTWQRVLNCTRLTLGIVPLLAATAAGFVLGGILPRAAWMTLASILCLHLAYLPYWFVGIFGFHYVFETVPLWLLWFAAVSHPFWRTWRTSQRAGWQLWYCGVLAAAFAIAYIPADPLWSATFWNLPVARHHAAEPYHKLQRAIERSNIRRPAIVLIESDAAEFHLDLVNNAPALDADILRGRYLPNEYSLEQIAAALPNRSIWLYRQKEGRLQRLKP